MYTCDAVVSGTKLKNTEFISRQDPYVCLEYGSTKFRTRTCTGTVYMEHHFCLFCCLAVFFLKFLIWFSNHEFQLASETQTEAKTPRSKRSSRSRWLKGYGNWSLWFGIATPSIMTTLSAPESNSLFFLSSLLKECWFFSLSLISHFQKKKNLFSWCCYL